MGAGPRGRYSIDAQWSRRPPRGQAMTEREQIARRTVDRYVWWSAGGALVPIPLVDMALITGAQLKMLAELSKLYGVPFEQIRVKAVIGSLMGYVLHPPVSTGVLGRLLRAIPGLGFLVGTPMLVLFEGAFAWALGRVFIQHFESGGTFLDFDPETARRHFRAQLTSARKVAAATRA